MYVPVKQCPVLTPNQSWPACAIIDNNGRKILCYKTDHNLWQLTLWLAHITRLIGVWSHNDSIVTWYIPMEITHHRVCGILGLAQFLAAYSLYMSGCDGGPKTFLFSMINGHIDSAPMNTKDLNRPGRQTWNLNFRHWKVTSRIWRWPLASDIPQKI